MNNPTIVLAYSGGLDTSYCIKYLDSICDYEVHAVYVNTGGLSPQQAIELEEKAYALGAVQFQLIEARTDFYDKCLKYLIYGNILRNHNYPLSVSAERSFQALKVLEYAQQVGATKIAHGSTAAGNDQVRF
ncbi:MAG: argininosuccinate synthase domain-containing protein, partial [Bacteroidota bacterium]